MNIIRFIKSLFKKRAGKYEVWDTSAISNHFEEFKKTLKSEKVKVIIPEGVVDEIEKGRRLNEHCKEIYKFIYGNLRNPYMIVGNTPMRIRNGKSVDEQVVYIAELYYNKGYDTTMITCDRHQSLKARVADVKVKLMSIMKAKAETHTQNHAEKTLSVPKVLNINTEKTVEASIVDFEKCKDEIELPAQMLGKQCRLKFDARVSVYDSKGKRRIGTDKGIFVSKYDTVFFNNERYTIKSIGTTVVLKKS